ncbi:chromosome segregation protein SMC [Methylovulum psychrotolerans]|uniref:Chromosome segregation protein SMC n=2 Tax=Methylovulum psychrotolerans TaxID=1704499 RepID=A0A1Z4BUT1_9GAMM|nr:chromosome segregation protein SMC [Methylovulum psychrotolerans]
MINIPVAWQKYQTMKILSLYFKNINSLMGESRISFSKGPIANTGVFAITGANGSGKSSILDAITLALYGETARFDRPAATVISQNANEAYAEVEFKLGDDKYQSTWQAQRAPHDGEEQTVAMQLTRLSDGAVLADGSVAVCSAIRDLTGMSFRGFTRSMLLAQNEFTAFLHALDNERMDILETLIGTDIYADYRNEIIGNADKAQQAVDALKQELASLKPLTPAEQEASEQDLQDYQEQIQELKEAQKQLEQQQHALKNTANLQTQVVEQKKRLKDLQTQLAANGQTLAEIAVAKQALNFQDDLKALESQQQTLQQHKAAWEALQNEQHFLREQLGDNSDLAAKAAGLSFSEQHQTLDGIKFAINQARLDKQEAAAQLQALETQLGEKNAALAEVQAWLADHAGDGILLDNFPETAPLKILRAELNVLSDAYKQSGNALKAHSTAIKNTQTALSQTQADIAALQQELADEEQARAALLQGHHADEIDSLKAEQEGRLKQFQQVLDVANQYQKISQPGGGLLSLFGRKPPLIEDPDALKAELAQLRDIIKREENIKLALESAVSREALVKKLLGERVHLVDGKPCPLCGAKEHPYLKHAPVLGNSVQALTDQQMKLRQLAAQTDQLNKRIVAAQKYAEQNRATQAQLQSIKDAWLSQCNRLNKATADADIGQLAVMEQWLKEERDELKNIIALGEQYRKKTATIDKINAAIAKNEATLSQLHSEAEQLAAATADINEAHLVNEAALIPCREQEQALAVQVQAQLTALGETMPGKGKEDAFFDRLNSRRQDYQTHQFHSSHFIEEVAGLESRYAANQATLQQADADIDRLMASLQSEELIGVHLALIEKQQLIAEKERVLSEQEGVVGACLQALQIRLQSSPFAGLAELRQALQFAAQEPVYLKRQGDIEVQLTAKQQQLENLSAELDTDFMLAETAPDPDDIYRQLTQLAEKTDIAQLEIQRLQKRLAQHQQTQQRYTQLTAQLQQREQEAQPALAERAILDNENGMAFRRRVQIRIAAQLLEKTNRILEKISHRYYLRHNTEQPGLSLEVEDTAQNNRRRAPKTLSGGESFVVSLALALSLSELANNNKSVESLFIDEGFGCLDGDSLTVVLSALEKLPAYGKTVGVISHLEGVRKRIKTQVQVVKKSNGVGVLKVA